MPTSTAQTRSAPARKRSSPPLPPRNARKRRKSGFLRFVRRLFWTGVLACVLFAGWFYLTPSGKTFRDMVADTIITTQHREWAKYIIGEKNLRERVAAYQSRFDQMGEERDTHRIVVTEQSGPVKADLPLTSVEEVSGKGYHGYLLSVRDPKKIRLVVPQKRGRGEKVSSMVKRTGALYGVNAGGFADPNWKGNGFQPIGVVICQGQVYYDGLGSNKSTQIVGLDRNGKMVAGRYTLKELMDLGISEGVTFSPRIIVNGKGLIKNRGEGWGIAPRSVMAQKEDGTVMFLLIDGRQPGYSIGATLYDAQEILLEHGAVIAANLDGGSSTVLVNGDGEVVNKPSSAHGERYLPTAFLVFDDPSSVQVPNIWAGLKPSDIDPGKW
ncbi:phosphodiester glycosidase family protein [Cohnella caldifontis]|uniref:phosphodiester glycosidase family protein n=1 Tax=Cohnella caldifontis TaxID=3027471 RepID=UPI0023EAF1ED|nr:phosphodiester glycosidase family protein [Cohnella sp. YIM B05605]